MGVKYHINQMAICRFIQRCLAARLEHIHVARPRVYFNYSS